MHITRDLFIPVGPPQASHQGITPPTAETIHPNLDAMIFEQACELQTDALTVLIRVEDLPAPILRDRFSYHVNAEVPVSVLK